MAMAADSSSMNNHAPSASASSSSPAGGDGGANSPQSRRRSLQSPWAQVVRGVEPESSLGTVAAPRSPSSSPPIAAATAAAADAVPPEQTAPPETENSAPEFQLESSDDGNGNGNGNASRSKKPAWSKPLNGIVEGTSVMGGSESWPALSESTRSTGKSSSDSLKALSDGSASSSQGPIISQTPQKPANTNAKTNSVANHGMPRQRSMRNRGAGSVQGGFNRPSPPTPPPMPPPFPAIIEVSPYGNYGNFVPPVLDSSVRGARPISVVGSPAGNDHSTHSQRNSSRRNNFGGRPRGDGQYHNNHGGRRDHDRRDVHLPHQFVPPPPPPGGYMPPPPPPSPGSAPFIAPTPMRPFVTPMGFDVPPPFLYVPTLPPPYVAAPPPPPMFYPVMDPPLPALIVKQIDYYFSDPNLVKDDYLRSNMDEEGWVPINLIASFPRVQQRTTDIPLILDSLKASMVVEIKGDKIRRRNDWRKWIHTGGSHVSPESGSHTPGTSSEDILTTSINMISLNEGISSGKKGASDSTDSAVESERNRPSAEDAAGSSIVANGDVSAEEEEEESHAS